MTEVRLYKMVAGMPDRVTLDETTTITGGEGTIRFTQDNKYAVKIFHDGIAEVKRDKLSLVMRLFSQLSSEQEQFLLPPLALVDELNRKKVFGFVMRRVPCDYTELINTVLNPVVAVRHFKAGAHWGHLLYVARSVAESVAVLHGKGCSHTDIHYKNFMVSLKDAQAIMLEIDGVAVKDFLKPGVFGLQGFMAPEILMSWQPDESASEGGNYTLLPDKVTDSYSLAILILHILLLRNVMTPLTEYADEVEESDRLGFGNHAIFSEHPQDRRHRPVKLGHPLFDGGTLSYMMLTPKLRALAESTFVTNLFVQQRRPLAREWAIALAVAADGLLMCVTCKQCFLYQHWLPGKTQRTCPFCGTLPAYHPPVVEFLEEGVKGRFRSIDRYVTFSPGSFLFADQIQANRTPPFRRTKADIVGHTVWNSATGHLHLVNDAGQCWLCNGQSVRNGQSVPLVAGMVMYFGSGYRLAMVRQ